jgi:hypothetical protein
MDSSPDSSCQPSAASYFVDYHLLNDNYQLLIADG